MSLHHARSGIIKEQWPLLLLIASLTIIWLAQTFGPADWADAFMVVPADVVHSWNQLRSGSFVATDLTPFGTLLSSAFLHGDIEHLAFNSFYLWIFAALITRHLGKIWFVAMYALTAIAGSVAHTLLDPTSAVPMLGASGAVMGFEGAYLGLAMRYRLGDPHIWPMAHPIPPAQLVVITIIGVAFDFQGVLTGTEDFIARGAHIGGFLMGLFIASFVRADEEPR